MKFLRKSYAHSRPLLIFCCLCAWLAGTSNLAAQNRWTLKTADTRIVLGLDGKGSLNLFELSSPLQKFNWVQTPSPFPFLHRVDVGGDSVATNWKFQRATVDKKGGTKLTLLFTNANPGLELISVWEARPGPGPIRQSMELKNKSGKDITIFNQESIDLHVAGPSGNTSVVYINDDASVPDPVGIYNQSLDKEFAKDLTISESHDWIPFVLLNGGNTYGMYIGWEWSIGRLRIAKENNDPRVILKAGNGDDFKTDVLKGETFAFAPGFIGAYKGDLDDCGNSLRKYLFNYSMPAQIRNDPGFPKVEWNAFAALGKKQGGWDPVESKYYPLINDIAPLGFEEVVIDIGWWMSYGDPGHIITDSVDWPHGMPAAADYAKARHMRFGLYDNETENLTSDTGKSERFRDISYLINNLHADFYRSDATAGPIAQGKYGKNMRAAYKQDVAYWSIKGFYEVIDSMYKSIPTFLWENCSSGGGLKDYGAIRRAGKIQNQDVYYPVQARRSFYDASHALHPIQIAALVGSWEPWQAAGSVYEFRSASMGASYWHPDAPNGGNGGPVWSTQQKADIQKAVTTYKEKLRPLIRNANLYHIFPRPDSVHWDGVQYYDPATKKGVVYIFKPKNIEDQHTIKLKGLDPSMSYHVTFEDGSNKPTVLTGSALMKTGIVVSLEGELASELMFIEGGQADSLRISMPVSRIVYQRNNRNMATVPVKGTAPAGAGAIEARLVAREKGQGTTTGWTRIANGSGGAFSGSITGRGGWYKLELRAMKGRQAVAAAVVDRVGIGEVFIIAGHSVAQGGEINIEGASDDRVSTVQVQEKTPRFETYLQTGDPQYLPEPQFVQAATGVAHAPFGHNNYFWSKFGELLVQQERVPVLIFNAGFGGTSLEHWAKSSQHIAFEHGFVKSAIRMPYINLLNAFKKYISLTGVRAILADQGQNDNPQKNADSILANYKIFIDQARKDINFDELALVVNRQSFGTAPAVRTAQERMAKEPHCYPGADYDLLLKDDTVDGIHLSASGEQKAAVMWAQSLTKQFFTTSKPWVPSTTTTPTHAK